MTAGDGTRRFGWPTVVALVASLAGPPAIVLVSDLMFGASPSIGAQVILELVFCALAAFVIFVVIRVERLSLDSIGLRRPGWATVIWAALLVVIGLFVMPLLTDPLVTALGSEGRDAGVREILALPIWFRVFVGATAGLVEEILYRGYAIERLATLTGRRWLGAAIATVTFGLAHVPAWGLAFSLAADLPAGILLAASYLWRRDLLANILAHSGSLIFAMLTLRQ